ncbi:YlaF family protein [Sutcliffiella rhizosphaerae]|uniref:YlaF family protein n=1 Tax=Sutcliffiella rhizosphaerae TaxID=2880967 RepID=A0ABM8YJ84_9BACI|nr:YlaF family protein [Sutcliffiella rhizosphaerae]CAG9619865.1 hypothetical protein BACCIP111883_00633 [Sutcliffiella rhizosphaerae]
MKNIKWIFILFAVLAAVSLGLVGIAIGERSTLGIIGAFVLFALVMGFGFKTKKKMRESGQL